MAEVFHIPTFTRFRAPPSQRLCQQRTTFRSRPFPNLEAIPTAREHTRLPQAYAAVNHLAPCDPTTLVSLALEPPATKARSRIAFQQPLACGLCAGPFFDNSLLFLTAVDRPYFHDKSAKRAVAFSPLLNRAFSVDETGSIHLIPGRGMCLIHISPSADMNTDPLDLLSRLSDKTSTLRKFPPTRHRPAGTLVSGHWSGAVLARAAMFETSIQPHVLV